MFTATKIPGPNKKHSNRNITHQRSLPIRRRNKVFASISYWIQSRRGFLKVTLMPKLALTCHGKHSLDDGNDSSFWISTVFDDLSLAAHCSSTKPAIWRVGSQQTGKVNETLRTIRFISYFLDVHNQKRCCRRPWTGSLSESRLRVASTASREVRTLPTPKLNTDRLHEPTIVWQC